MNEGKGIQTCTNILQLMHKDMFFTINICNWITLKQLVLMLPFLAQQLYLGKDKGP